MSNFNRKGFMLAEVVVVSVIVASVLVTSYISLNRISSAYETRNRYHDIDAEYLAIEANDFFIRTNYLTTLEDTDFKTEMGDGIYLIIDDNPGIEDVQDLYTSIFNYNSANIFTVKYDKNEVENFKNSIIQYQGAQGYNNTLIDFAKYLNDSIDFDDTDNNYKYIIVSELCKNTDDCYYYALKVKGEEE